MRLVTLALLALPLALPALALPAQSGGLMLQAEIALADTLSSVLLDSKPEPVHGVLDLSHLTILEILNATLHRSSERDDAADLPLRRLAYIVNKSPQAIANLDTKGPITLLAPDDSALTPPHHGHEGAEAQREHPFHSMQDDDDTDEQRKERVARIIGYLLKYHTIDSFESTDDLANRSTVPTTLAAARGSDELLRVRVEPSYQLLPFPHPILLFNFYAKKEGPTVLAKNGVIHLINHPLLPPFTVLNDLFLAPQIFSTLTSSIQKVGLDEALLPPHSLVAAVMRELEHEHGVAEGTFTVLAPTNFAFDRLGPKVLALLMSPFPRSKDVLKYLLMYHVIPDVIFHSDFISPSAAAFITGNEIDLAEDKNVTSYKFPTLLATSGTNENGTVEIDVVSFRRFGKGPILREILIRQAHKEDERMGPVKVWKADAVARHGAIHTLNSVLRPPYRHHGDEEMAALFA